MSKFIANILPKEHFVNRTHGIYTILACKEGEPYSLFEVTDRADRGLYDVGNDRYAEERIFAQEIAADLVNDINSGLAHSDNPEDVKLSFDGVFICEGSAPTERELKDARSRYDKFCDFLIRQADATWDEFHHPRFIRANQRVAARYRGVKRDWLYEVVPQSECPACGDKLKIGVAVCKGCGAIIDAEKAKKFGLGQVAVSEVPKKRMGRPPKKQPEAEQVSAT